MLSFRYFVTRALTSVTESVRATFSEMPGKRKLPVSSSTSEKCAKISSFFAPSIRKSTGGKSNVELWRGAGVGEVSLASHHFACLGNIFQGGGCPRTPLDCCLKEYKLHETPTSETRRLFVIQYMCSFLQLRSMWQEASDWRNWKSKFNI